MLCASSDPDPLSHANYIDYLLMLQVIFCTVKAADYRVTQLRSGRASAKICLYHQHCLDRTMHLTSKYSTHWYSGASEVQTLHELVGFYHTVLSQ